MRLSSLLALAASSSTLPASRLPRSRLTCAHTPSVALSSGAVKPSVEVVYAVTSLDHRAADAQLLARWLQGHWAIENRVHHVRDVTQREDASRIRLGSGPQMMAALRNTATNIARLGGQHN